MTLTGQRILKPQPIASCELRFLVPTGLFEATGIPFPQEGRQLWLFYPNQSLAGGGGVELEPIVGGGARFLGFSNPGSLPRFRILRAWVHSPAVAGEGWAFVDAAHPLVVILLMTSTKGVDGASWSSLQSPGVGKSQAGPHFPGSWEVGSSPNSVSNLLCCFGHIIPFLNLTLVSVKWGGSHLGEGKVSESLPPDHWPDSRPTVGWNRYM